MKWNVKRTVNEGTRREINDAFNFQWHLKKKKRCPRLRLAQPSYSNCVYPHFIHAHSNGLINRGDLWPSEVNCRLIKKKPTHHAAIHSWLWLGFDSMWLILVELETAGWQQEVDVSAPSAHRFMSGLATNAVSVGGGGWFVILVFVWEKSVKRALRQSFGTQSDLWIVPC